MSTTRAIRRLPLFVVAAVVPVVVLVGSLIVAALLAAGITHPVVVHFGVNGNSTAPAWTIPIAMFGVGLIALALGLGVAIARPDSRHLSFAQKVLAVIALGQSVLVAALGVWLLAVQQSADAPTPPVLPGIPIIVGGGLLIAVIAWFLLPPAEAWGSRMRTAEPLALAPGERAVWTATTRLTTLAIVVLVVAILLVASVAIVVTVLTAGATWIVLALPVILVAVLFSSSSYGVRVDENGLRVRSALGWPVFSIPAREVESAGVSAIEPLREFGGWGLRGTPRRFAVVTRGGEGLEVHRRDGRVFLVTVDDAATGAALLTAVAER
ncbi:MAG: hypothetical protein ABIR17_09245 [Pseudolysinimonas sp.]|uniref:hypothetical protein n=1 Tax=Pseudolysinimonas sp. TaxID=2680009 RepID=UPI003263B293